MTEKRVLLEDTLWVKSNDIAVTESVDEKTGASITMIECPFQAADIKNKNGRLYPRAVLENVLESVKHLVTDKGLHGHLGHPKDGVGDDGEITHTVIELKMDAKGVVHGKAEINDTPRGKIVQEYKKKNYLFGISSRGIGSVNSEGVVQEDYELRAFDIVINPSTPGATVKPLSSHKTNENVVSIKSEAATEDIKPELAVVTEDRENVGGSEKNGHSKEEVPMSALAQFKQLELDAKPMLALKESDIGSPWELEKTRNEMLDLTGELSNLEESVKVQRERLIARLEEKREEMSEWHIGGRLADSDSQDTADEKEKKVAEAEELRTKLEEAEKALEEAKKEAEAAATLAEEIKKKNDELSAKLAETVAEKDQAEGHLSGAIEIISVMTSVMSDASVAESLEEHLAKDERLAAFKEILVRCESKEELDATVGKLTEAMADTKPAKKRREEGHLPQPGAKVTPTPAEQVTRKEGTTEIPLIEDVEEDAPVEVKSLAFFHTMNTRNKKLEEARDSRHVTMGRLDKLNG